MMTVVQRLFGRVTVIPAGRAARPPDVELAPVRVLADGRRAGRCPTCKRIRIIAATGPAECPVDGRGEVPAPPPVLSRPGDASEPPMTLWPEAKGMDADDHRWWKEWHFRAGRRWPGI